MQFSIRFTFYFFLVFFFLVFFSVVLYSPFLRPRPSTCNMHATLYIMPSFSIVCDVCYFVVWRTIQCCGFSFSLTAPIATIVCFTCMVHVWFGIIESREMCVCKAWNAIDFIYGFTDLKCLRYSLHRATASTQ